MLFLSNTQPTVGFKMKQPNLGLAQLLPQLCVCVTLPPSLPLLSPLLLDGSCMPSFCCCSAKERNLKKKKKREKDWKKSRSYSLRRGMEKHTGSLCTNPHVSQMVFFPLSLLIFSPFFSYWHYIFIHLFSAFSISASIAVSSQPLFFACVPLPSPHTIMLAADAVLSCLSRCRGAMNEL